MGYSKLSPDNIQLAKDCHLGLKEYRFYHNWEHVERCYYHASDTFGFSYDEELDWAIAYHDSVYDSGSDKELRSARYMEMVRSNGKGAPSKATELILSTTNHVPYPDPRMVLVDLADFMYDAARKANFEKILRENMCLYPDVSVRDILKAMVTYLDDLSNRIKPFTSLGKDHYRDFVVINSGIRDQIIEINELRLR